MANLKTISIITATVVLCSLSSNAFAQSAPTANSAAEPVALSTAPVAKRTIKRIVEPLPMLATPRSTKKSKLYARAPYSKAVSGQVNKFIINNKNHKISTPVYFGKDALKSR